MPRARLFAVCCIGPACPPRGLTKPSLEAGGSSQAFISSSSSASEAEEHAAVMEVFLGNVPATLTDEALRRELAPFMNALGIVDWAVDKTRRKPMAWLTFLQIDDGRKFLKSHGKISSAKGLGQPPSTTQSGLTRRTRDMARLCILSTAIYAERSRREVDALTLSHLLHERHERQKVVDKGPRTPDISCAITEISCGKLIYAPPATGLKFVSQSRFRVGGMAKFARQGLTIWGQDSRVDILYDAIHEVIANHSSQSIMLVLEEPPRFYSKSPCLQGSNVNWERQTSCPLWTDHAKYVAHCLVYQLTPTEEYQSIIRAIKAQDILPLSQQNIPVASCPAPTVEDYATGISAFEGKMQSLGTTREGIIPFPILFQVQSLVWNNYLHPYGGLCVLDHIARIARERAQDSKTFPFTTDAFKRLLQTMPYPVPGTDTADVDPVRVVESMQAGKTGVNRQNPLETDVYGASLPQHQTWVFKAMVTPTRILLEGPDAESKNRVLRMFRHHGDHFLRVSFCDERGQDLSFSPRVRNDAIYERYRKVLADGIRIAGRHFSFLGFSHSSLRSHSTWFLAPFVDADLQRQDHDTILKSLGDFSKIRVAAKCAARIGQFFSETPFAVDLFKAGIDIRYIPDVKSADGKRVFSDGVGTISREAMQEFWKALPMRTISPTCFQIRWAGAKGMLALNSTLRGKVICIRKDSMMKFPSQDLRELGICDVASRPLRLVLNRQIIKILEDMGTKPQWFVAQQEKALNILRQVTATAGNTSIFLRSQDIGSAIGLPSFIKQLDKMSIDYRRDRFLKSVVEHAVLRELRLLKHKARIPVDKGVTLFGIMDETGFLNENEIFITYDKVYSTSGARMDATLRDGPVIVTRCPALHPGDIQHVTAVSPPDGHPLRGLRNCVVFSQKGSRDLPSQLSGGDLDGDLYNIIWDRKAAPRFTFNPADYPRVIPEPLDRPVTRDDIAAFFLNFMKSDILGLIANRHQILADMQPEGTKDASCVKLAEMHSTAVDYSKTGIAVSWSDMPKAPRLRPDFLAPAPPVRIYDRGQIDHIAMSDDEDDENGLGGAKPRYYRSEKLLGRLYRGIDENKIWSEHIHRAVPMTGPSIWDQLKGRIMAELNSYGIRTEFSRHEDHAWKIRNLYEDSILDSMWHFSENPRKCITEAEVFCGSVLNKTGTQTRRQRDASIRLKEDTDRILTWICSLIRNRIDDRRGHSGDWGRFEDNDDEHVAIQLCWACLVVGCIEQADNFGPTYHRTGELESFRIVAAACLLKELNTFKASRLIGH
ncbi:RNA-dependent RNA polymerase [Metarhizium album ARSEF 1941]|uniref:RNA-dependent RNA polymerase n=1 Tax=Metarhizium album (strain ARSEF 1941) TaxID=1081103 RepID=A0A0B2WTX0_METAS|nr:RNA-dependent RNA polymerase [Metarhizium album ARSEF 1941]KHN97503.1 RNA-dependent RNA polymerase [Metarhizium album ARSEF 1941]